MKIKITEKVRTGLYAKLSELLVEFDASAMARCMRAMNHHWYIDPDTGKDMDDDPGFCDEMAQLGTFKHDGAGYFCIPTERMIRREIRTHFIQLFDRETEIDTRISMGTGGLEYYVDVYGKEDGEDILEGEYNIYLTLKYVPVEVSI